MGRKISSSRKHQPCARPLRQVARQAGGVRCRVRNTLGTFFAGLEIVFFYVDNVVLIVAFVFRHTSRQFHPKSRSWRLPELEDLHDSTSSGSASSKITRKVNGTAGADLRSLRSSEPESARGFSGQATGQGLNRKSLRIRFSMCGWMPDDEIADDCT